MAIKTDLDLKPLQDEIKKITSLLEGAKKESAKWKQEMQGFGKTAKTSASAAEAEIKRLTGVQKTLISSLEKLSGEQTKTISKSETYKKSLEEQTEQYKKAKEEISALENKLSDLQKKYKESNKSASKTTKQLEKIFKALSDEKRKYEESATALRNTTQAYKKLEQISQDLGKTNTKLRSQNKRLVKNYIDMGKTVSKQNKKIESMASEYKKLEKRITKLAKAHEKLSAEQKHSNQGWSNGSDNLVRFNRQLRQVLPFLTTTMIAWKSMEVFQNIIDQGGSFRQELVKVNAVLQTTSKEAMDLEKEIRSLGSTTEWTASQVASGAKFLGMAGMSATQTTQALKSVLELSTAGQIDIARAADISSNAMIAMGLNVEDLSRVNDTFIATTTMSNVNIEQMADTFRYAAPKAKAYGYSIEALSAMIGVLGNSGVQGSLAGTQLSFAMGKVDDVFRSLGMSGSGKSLLDALEAINEAGWTTGDIFDNFAERGGRAAVMLRDVIPLVRLLQKRIEESKGISKKIAEDMRNTFVNDLKILESAFSELGIGIFDEWNDSLREAAQSMTEFVNNNKDDIIEFFGDIGRGVDGAVESLRGFSPMLGKIGEALGFLGNAFEKHPALMSAMGLMITGNPYAMVVGAASGIYALTETSVSQNLQDIEVKKMMEEKYSLQDVTKDNWAEKTGKLDAEKYVNLWKDYKNILISKIDEGINKQINQNIENQNFLQENSDFLGEEYVDKEILKLEFQNEELKKKMSPLKELNEKNTALLIEAWKNKEISKETLKEMVASNGKNLNFDASKLLEKDSSGKEIQDILAKETAWLNKQQKGVNQLSKALEDFDNLLQDLNVKPNTTLEKYLDSIGVEVEDKDIREIGKIFKKFNDALLNIKNGLTSLEQSKKEIEKQLATTEFQIRYKKNAPRTREEAMLFETEPERLISKLSIAHLEDSEKAQKEELKLIKERYGNKEVLLKEKQDIMDSFFRNYTKSLDKEKEIKEKIRKLAQKTTDQATIDMGSQGYLSGESFWKEIELASAKTDYKVSKGEITPAEGEAQKTRDFFEESLKISESQFSYLKEKAQREKVMVSELSGFENTWEEYKTALSMYWKNVLGASDDQVSAMLKRKKEEIVGENTEIQALIEELDKNAELIGKTDLQKKLVNIQNMIGTPEEKREAKTKTIQNAFAGYKQQLVGETTKWKGILEDLKIIARDNISQDPLWDRFTNLLGSKANIGKGNEIISKAKLTFNELLNIEGEFKKKFAEIQEGIATGKIDVKNEEEIQRLTNIAKQWKTLSESILGAKKELLGFSEISSTLGVKSWKEQQLALEEYQLSLNKLGFEKTSQKYVDLSSQKEAMLKLDWLKAWYKKASELEGSPVTENILNNLEAQVKEVVENIYNDIDWTTLTDKLGLTQDQIDSFKKMFKLDLEDLDGKDKKDKTDTTLQDRLSLYREYYKDVAGMAEGLYALEAQLAEENYKKNLKIFESMKGVNAEALAQAIKQEELFRASREIILAKGTETQGIDLYFTELKKEMKSAAEFWYETLKTVETELSSGFSNAVFSAIKGDMEDLENAFKGIGDNILKSFTDRIAEQFVKENIMPSLEFLFPGAGNIMNSPELNEAKVHTNLLSQIAQNTGSMNSSLKEATSDKTTGGSELLSNLGTAAMIYASISSGNTLGGIGLGMNWLSGKTDMFGQYQGVADAGLAVGGTILSGYGLYNSFQNDNTMGMITNGVSLAKNAAKLYEMYNEANGLVSQISTYGSTLAYSDATETAIQALTENGLTLYSEPGLPVPYSDKEAYIAENGGGLFDRDTLQSIREVGNWIAAGAQVYSTISNWDDYSNEQRVTSTGASAAATWSAASYMVNPAAWNPLGAVIAGVLSFATNLLGDSKHPKAFGDVTATKTEDGQLFNLTSDNFRNKDWGISQEEFDTVLNNELKSYQQVFLALGEESQAGILAALPDAISIESLELKPEGFVEYSEPYQYQWGERKDGTPVYETRSDLVSFEPFSFLDSIFLDNGAMSMVVDTLQGYKELSSSVYDTLKDKGRVRYSGRPSEEPLTRIEPDETLKSDIDNLLSENTNQYSIKDIATIMNELAVAQEQWEKYSKYMTGTVFSKSKIYETEFDNYQDPLFDNSNIDRNKAIDEVYANIKDVITKNINESVLSDIRKESFFEDLGDIDKGYLDSADGLEKFRGKLHEITDAVAMADIAFESAGEGIRTMTGRDILSISDVIDDLTTQFDGLVGAMLDAGVSTERITEIENTRASVLNQSLGVQITGLNANSLSESLLSGDLSGAITGSLQTAAANMISSAFSERVMTDTFSPAMESIGSLFASIGTMSVEEIIEAWTQAMRIMDEAVASVDTDEFNQAMSAVGIQTGVATEQIKDFSAALDRISTSIDQQLNQLTMSKDMYSIWSVQEKYLSNVQDILEAGGGIGMLEKATRIRDLQIEGMLSAEKAAESSNRIKEALKKAENSASIWGSAAQSFGRLSDDLLFSSDNPDTADERLASMKAWFEANPITEENADDVANMWQRYIDTAEETYQRPSLEYQRIYASTLDQISDLETYSKDKEDIALDIAGRQESLLEDLNLSSSGISRGITSVVEAIAALDFELRVEENSSKEVSSNKSIYDMTADELKGYNMNILKEYAQYFTNTPEGTSQDWLGGTLTRMGGDKALWEHDGKSYNMDRYMPIADLVKMAPELMAEYMKIYDLTESDIKKYTFSGYADGTNYVPQTGPYLLHQGEAVIPANQNRDKKGDGDVNVSIVMNVSGDSAGKLGQNMEQQLVRLFSNQGPVRAAIQRVRA